VPRLFGRLWRTGARHSEVGARPVDAAQPADVRPAEAAEERHEFGRRIEAARQRLRETIPPQEEGRQDEPSY
jgi:hypothetical protein